MELDRCPTCGSELDCGEGLTYTYCVSPECGAVFHDLDLRGLGERARLDGTPRRTTSPAPHATPARRSSRGGR